MLVPINGSHVDVLAGGAGVKPHSTPRTHIGHICNEAHRRAAVFAMTTHFLPPSCYVRTAKRAAGSRSSGNLVGFARYDGKQRFVLRAIIIHIEKRTYVHFSRLAS
jgi:hypothetical protein